MFKNYSKFFAILLFSFVVIFADENDDSAVEQAQLTSILSTTAIKDHNNQKKADKKPQKKDCKKYRNSSGNQLADTNYSGIKRITYNDIDGNEIVKGSKDSDLLVIRHGLMCYMCIDVNNDKKLNNQTSQSGRFSALLVNLIDKAVSDIYIHMFSMTDRKVWAALVRAMQRGLKVNMVLDHSQASSKGSIFGDESLEGQKRYNNPVEGRLGVASIKKKYPNLMNVYIDHISGGCSHKKSLVFVIQTGKAKYNVFTVGTYNVTNNAEKRNQEEATLVIMPENEAAIEEATKANEPEFNHQLLSDGYKERALKQSRLLRDFHIAAVSYKMAQLSDNPDLQKQYINDRIQKDAESRQKSLAAEA